VKESDSKAVVLLSGGLDSAVTLAAAAADIGRDRCWTISFDYGQRHRVELAAAERVAESLGVATARRLVLKVDLRAIGGSALTADIDVPKDSGPRAEHDVPITYVPARNLIFLSCAAGYAETVGAGRIYIGANAVDYSGYPDCREPFLRAFEGAANAGTKAGAEDGRLLRVVAPLVHLSKVEIIRLGAKLGVDFSLTTSCYDPRVDEPSGRVLACGHCDSCLIRSRAFAEAGVKDPTVYVAEPAARSVGAKGRA
jgi:7-cyano-7-deazaguanine synthase